MIDCAKIDQSLLPFRLSADHYPKLSFHPEKNIEMGKVSDWSFKPICFVSIFPSSVNLLCKIETRIIRYRQDF